MSHLAAYVLAKTKYWKHLHTNGILCRQSQLTNVVIDQQDEMGECASILFTINIIPESEDSEITCNYILEVIAHKGQLLTKWSDIHASLFDNNHDFPLAEAITLTNLASYGVITSDTCNGAKNLLDY